MKIIKVGLDPKEIIWRGICENCKSEIEAKQSELKNIKRDYRSSDTFAWEICPVCKAGSEDNGYRGVLFYPTKLK